MSAKQRILLALSWWVAFPVGCGFSVLAFQVIGHLGDDGTVHLVRPPFLALGCALFALTVGGTWVALHGNLERMTRRMHAHRP